jgi:hypothetical protein
VRATGDDTLGSQLYLLAAEHKYCFLTRARGRRWASAARVLVSSMQENSAATRSTLLGSFLGDTVARL